MQMKTMQEIGYLTVITNPSDAKIYIDGTLMKDSVGNPIKTPAKLELYTGQHYITLEIDGYYKDSSYVYVYPNSEMILERNLSKLPYYAGGIIRYSSALPISPDVVGNLVITTYPAGATIKMDGKTVIDAETKELLKTPVELVVPIGLNNFTFTLPGYCNEFGTEYITAGFTSYIHRDFYVC